MNFYVALMGAFKDLQFRNKNKIKALSIKKYIKKYIN